MCSKRNFSNSCQVSLFQKRIPAKWHRLYDDNCETYYHHSCFWNIKETSGTWGREDWGGRKGENERSLLRFSISNQLVLRFFRFNFVSNQWNFLKIKLPKQVLLIFKTFYHKRIERRETIWGQKGKKGEGRRKVDDENEKDVPRISQDTSLFS